MDDFETWKNGITMRACRMDGTHSITLILMLKGGAAWEIACQKGITHLTEHLCFRRCSGMSQEEFYYKIEHMGAFLRGITYRDRVLFEITVIPKHFREAVDILRALFDENGWTPKDIRQEKTVVLRQMEDANDYCLETMTSDFFDRSVSGDPITGTVKKLERLTRPQIEACKTELFCPENCEIILTGPIVPEHTQYLRDRFSSVARTAAKERPDIRPKNFLNRRNKDDRLYAGVSDTVKIGLTWDVDTSKVLPIEGEFLQGLLCSGLFTPFAMRLREELGLLHEIQSGSEFFDFGGYLYLIFDVHRDSALLLLDEVTKILARQKNGVDRKAFDCIQAAYTDGAETLMDEPRRFAYELAFDSGISTPQSYIERNRQVSYERICRASSEIFQPRNLIISVNDIPREQEFRDAICEKKELLRQTLER
jgi:Predicted Zn-dependent peptidases